MEVTLEINQEINQENNTSNKKKQQAVPSWQEHHPVMFCGVFFSNMVISLLHVLESTMSQTSMVALYLSTCIVSIVMCVVDSCRLSKNICQFLKLYTLLDNAFLVTVIALVAMNGMQYIFFYGHLTTAHVALLVFLSLQLFVFTGEVRVIMAYAKWRPWQVITAKLSCLVACSIYIAIGTHYMIYQAEELSIMEADQANRVKDFIFFYAFGLFAYYLEIFSKISNLDGTSENKTRYSFFTEEDEEKLNKVHHHQSTQEGITSNI